MVDEFFLKSLIQITHGEIRLIDKERDIRRIGQTKEEEDPFFTDEIFFNDVLERRPEASIDIFWEDDVYYARVRRKGIQGQDLPRQPAQQRPVRRQRWCSTCT